MNCINLLEEQMLEEAFDRWQKRRDMVAERGIHHSVTSGAMYKTTDPMDKPKERDAYHGVCERCQFYEHMGAEPTNVEAKSLFKMRWGNQIHFDCYRLWEARGVLAKKEGDMAGLYEHPDLEFPISYRPDALLFDDDEYSLIDIKTTYGYGFSKIPKWSQRWQMSWYAKLLDPRAYEEWGIEISEYVITFFARDNANRRSLVAGKHFDFMDIDDVSVWVHLEECLKKKEVPERSYDRTHWMCKYCDYRDLCWEAHKNV